jgi:hypothetical protein
LQVPDRAAAGARARDAGLGGCWSLDNGPAPGDALPMTERAGSQSPYAIPVEDLVDSALVPLAAQIEEQPELRFRAVDPSGDLLWGDGMTGDADGV